MERRDFIKGIGMATSVAAASSALTSTAQAQATSPQPGVKPVTYEIKADGSLDGVWGGYGSERSGTEKATKQ